MSDSIKKIASASFVGLLMTGSVFTQPAGSQSTAPVGIDSLDTSKENATSSTLDVCDQNGSNCSSRNFGTGKNIKLNGFTVGDRDYKIFELVDKVKFQRKDNNFVTGERHIYFLEEDSNGSIASSAISTMEEAVRSEFINGGTDNVFSNNSSGAVNYNNIERVDFIVEDGFKATSNYVNNTGFLLLERGGNDPFKIAAITGMDANGNPNKFGNLISVSKDTWGQSEIKLDTSVFQNQSAWSSSRLTDDSVSTQYINGIFVSIASLGIIADQIIYGYAVFPNDINSSNDLVGLTDFPLNTDSSSGQGGLDLISSGGIFIPDDAPGDEPFLSFACSLDDGNNGHGNDPYVNVTTDNGINVAGHFDMTNPGNSLSQRMDMAIDNKDVEYNSLSLAQKQEVLDALAEKVCVFAD
ncbi:hypothetical protein [Myxosarcina sp. GI1]|uniref:hypothetical protein n=1 Tax=Myxosarcina sp. GI1 TaxID=1541065 RepID=UPI00056010C9|nr:hypothetical protein [Myxosarcina sp. GI1]